MVFYAPKYSQILQFGSEVFALLIVTGLITSFCYKLRMFGIPINGSTKGFCDNEAFYRNSTFIESQLKRKHYSICYHLVQEAVAAGKIVVFKIDGKENLADLLTKSVPGHRRKYLISKTMFSKECKEVK